jgi:hypothetical protein
MSTDSLRKGSKGGAKSGVSPCDSASGTSKIKPMPHRDEILRINVTLRGSDIPRWYREWKARGLVKSCTDAIAQAFRLYQERLTEFDLKKGQVENLRKTTDEG